MALLSFGEIILIHHSASLEIFISSLKALYFINLKRWSLCWVELGAKFPEGSVSKWNPFLNLFSKMCFGGGTMCGVGRCESRRGSSSLNAKALEPERKWCKSQFQDRRRQREVPAQHWAERQFPPPHLFVLSRPSCIGWCPLTLGRVICFISLVNLFWEHLTDTPWNNVSIWLISGIWTSGGPVRLTHKINPPTFIWKFSITPASMSLQVESRPLFL